MRYCSPDKELERQYAEICGGRLSLGGWIFPDGIKVNHDEDGRSQWHPLSNLDHAVMGFNSLSYQQQQKVIMWLMDQPKRIYKPRSLVFAVRFAKEFEDDPV